MNALFQYLLRSTRSVLWVVVASMCVLVMILVMAHSSTQASRSASLDAFGKTNHGFVRVSWTQDDSQDSADPVVGSVVEPAMLPSVYSARPAIVHHENFDVLGDIDDPQQRSAIVFTPLGAGIESFKLPHRFETVKREVHVTLQQKFDLEGTTFYLTPFAAIAVRINGSTVDLGGFDYPVWSQIEPGVFEAYVDDADGQPVVRVERRFTLKPGKEHGFYLDETIENIGNESIEVQLISSGAIDMPKADSSYGGDRRRVRYGFMLPSEQQGSSMRVMVDEELKNRNKLLGKKETTPYGKAYPADLMVWPNDEVLTGAARLSWLGLTDRYFAVIMHPRFEADQVQNPEDKLLNEIDHIDRLVINPLANQLDAVMLLRLTHKAHQIAPGQALTSSLGVYAGLRNDWLMSQEPEIASLSIPDLVVSNLGGVCAPCTFGWLTDILIAVLRTFHSIVGDWGVSILLLVVLVRSCLHPVTRWSQIRVQRFSVQMQEMAPKQKLIKEKYKNDSKKMQAEMGKLWKEEGISPAGMLGCLPMFLQSPVWIALYATLFFATELRHEPAFYGIFQSMGGWGFMNDLSAPDGAIPLPASMHFSFAMWGSVDSINILPLLLGVVFYLHQKYLTPPTQATLTPEQESQQKMMKVMMVVLFPVMMYAAPSGLALYFITNSAMGILENKWIRAHMKKHGMLEIENIRAQKRDKGPGFMQRMTEAAEAQRQLKEKGPAQPNPASKNSRRGKM